MTAVKYQYKRKSKFHITNREAAVIGDAFEKCSGRAGPKGVSVAKFAAFCAKKGHPVHDIWLRRRDQVVKNAGREAAAYLMRAVEIIIIHPKKGSVSAGRAITTIQVEDKSREVEGVGYHSSDVASNPDLLDQAEEDFVRQVRGLAESFTAIAGKARMTRRLMEIAKEVSALYS